MILKLIRKVKRVTIMFIFDDNSKFDDEKFVGYMHEEFPQVFSNFYEREWLENVVQYGLETFENEYERFSAFMISILPEIEEEDLIKFKV